LVDPIHAELSVGRQCALLGLARSSFYYEATDETAENLDLMRRVDEQYTQRPFYGSRRMTEWLKGEGAVVNRKRIARLMSVLGLEGLRPRRSRSSPGAKQRIYPYLLRRLAIVRPNQVWCTDITYVRMPSGFLYLMAIMDWFSRYVVGWKLSNTLDSSFCVETLEEVLAKKRPEIFNTDQGSQFTSQDFTGCLERDGVRISMDGRGRVYDNIFIERLWRTVKYEEIYLKDYRTFREAWENLKAYFAFYNEERRHQALDYRTPAEVYLGSGQALTVFA